MPIFDKFCDDLKARLTSRWPDMDGRLARRAASQQRRLLYCGEALGSSGRRRFLFRSSASALCSITVFSGQFIVCLLVPDSVRRIPEKPISFYRPWPGRRASAAAAFSAVMRA